MAGIGKSIFVSIVLASAIAVVPIASTRAEDRSADTSYAAPYSPAWQRVCDRVKQPQPPPPREPNATPAQNGSPETLMSAHCDQYLRAAASFQRAHQFGRSTR